MSTAPLPNRRKIFAYLLSIWILLNGCARLSFPNYEARHFDSYEESEVKEGLAVAISPMISEDEVRKYFGAGFVSTNLLPVFVALENRNSSTSFMLLRDNISVQIDKATIATSSAEKNVGDENIGMTVAVISFALISLPIAVLAGEMLAKAGAIRANAENRELTSKTISPGQNHKGFVYLQLPKKTNASQQWRMRIELLDQKTRQPITFDLPVQLTKE